MSSQLILITQNNDSFLACSLNHLVSVLYTLSPLGLAIVTHSLLI